MNRINHFFKGGLFLFLILLASNALFAQTCEFKTGTPALGEMVEGPDGTIYATERLFGNRFYTSTDDGTTFTQVGTAPGGSSNELVFSGNTLYLAHASGLAISTDGGANWDNRTTSNGLGSNSVWDVYVVGNTVYAATNGGVSISTDGGATFTSFTTGLGSTQVYSIFQSDGSIYAGTQGGLSISTDGGMTWVNKTTTDGLGNNSVRSIYVSDGTVYAASYNGSVSISTDKGATWTVKNPGVDRLEDIYVSDCRIYVWRFADFIDTGDPGWEVHSVGILGQSIDGGDTWTSIFALGDYGTTTVDDVKFTDMYESDGKIYVGASELLVCSELPTCPPAMLESDDLSVSDPCSCGNPDNIIDPATGLVTLFHDFLTVNTTPGLTTVTLSATDNNLLDASGTPIPTNTTFTETAAGSGIYQLEFYTVPNVPAMVTVSNGASTVDFTTASCSPCPSTIPVPTMSEWGLMIFGLLILNLSVFFVQRKVLI